MQDYVGAVALAKCLGLGFYSSYCTRTTAMRPAKDVWDPSRVGRPTRYTVAQEGVVKARADRARLKFRV